MYANNLFLFSCNEIVFNYYISKLTCFLILDRDKNLNNYYGKTTYYFFENWYSQQISNY